MSGSRLKGLGIVKCICAQSWPSETERVESSGFTSADQPPRISAVSAGPIHRDKALRRNAILENIPGHPKTYPFKG